MLKKIDVARRNLASDIRSMLMKLDPDRNIFDAMDHADEEISKLTNQEVVKRMKNQGLVWDGRFWINPQYLTN